MLKQLAPWILAGAGLLILVIIVQYNVDKRKALAAQQEAPQVAAQVQVIPAGFPYSQQMTDYCLQAAQQGWTPENCAPFYEYAQLYYPEFSPYLSSYWPWYYQNYYEPYYNDSWWWPASYGFWSGGCRGGRCHRRRHHRRRSRRGRHSRRSRMGGRRSRSRMGGRRSRSRMGGRRSGGGSRSRGGGRRGGGGRRR
uniref:Uncharacterized protein n=1 Tax=viral metagenome TaxID=1070528 RepID=A0A6C0BME1_9ZZZZ